MPPRRRTLASDQPGTRDPVSFNRTAKRGAELEDLDFDNELVLPSADRARAIIPIPLHELSVDPHTVRDAPPPTPGYRYLPDGRQVPVCDGTSTDLHDPTAQAIVLEIIEKTGSILTAADTLGIKQRTIREYMLEDIDFGEAVNESSERHRERIYMAAFSRAVEGYDVPIVGGKDKDQIVAYERKFSDSMLGKMLERHFAEFRKQPAQVKIDASTNNSHNTQVNVGSLDRSDRDSLRKLLEKADDPSLPEPDPAITVIDLPESTS